MEYIGVYLVDMPGAVKAFTVKNCDDSFSIFINAGLSDIMQREAYDHEIEHIDNGDYDQIYDVDDLERIRHKMSA